MVHLERVAQAVAIGIGEGGVGEDGGLGAVEEAVLVGIVVGALVAMSTSLQGIDAQLVNVVHDELVVEAAERDVAAVEERMVAAMTTAAQAVLPRIGTRNLVEVHHGRNWAAAK